MKSQTIRVFDVVLIGPLMIWGGIVAAKKNKIPGTALGLLGVATMLYNARNHAAIEKARLK